MKVTEHNRSNLLTSDENDVILSLFKARQLSLCTTIVEIYQTEGPFHTNWKLYNTAVLCLVKDNSKKSYYFKAYSFDRLLWSEELYVKMEYTRHKLYFHSFEATNCIIGFNFADTKEAETFYDIVQKKIVNLSRTKTVISKGRALKNKLSKIEIGMPINFQHVQHVSLRSDEAYNIRLTSEEFKSFFDKSGLDHEVIERRSTRRVINSFIEAYGEDKIRKAITDNSPIRTSSNLATIPQEPDARNKTMPSPKPPIIPTRVVSKESHITNIVPAPPPPPPPLLPQTAQETKPNYERIAPPPSSPTKQNDTPSLVDGRSNLLESIRRGTKLKPANERKLSEQPITIDTDTNHSIMDIRQALQDALLKRNNVLAVDESSSSNEGYESSDSDAWD